MKIIIIVGYGKIVNALLDNDISSWTKEYKIILVSSAKHLKPGIVSCTYGEFNNLLIEINSLSTITESNIIFASWKGQNGLTDGDFLIQIDNISRLFELYEISKQYSLQKVMNLSSFHEILINTPFVKIPNFPIQYSFSKKNFHALLKCKTHLDKLVLINICFSSFIVNTNKQLNFVGNYLCTEMKDSEIQNPDMIYDLTTLECILELIKESIVGHNFTTNIYVGNSIHSKLPELKKMLNSAKIIKTKNEYILDIIDSTFDKIIFDKNLLNTFKLCTAQ